MDGGSGGAAQQDSFSSASHTLPPTKLSVRPTLPSLINMVAIPGYTAHVLIGGLPLPPRVQNDSALAPRLNGKPNRNLLH